MTGRSGLLNLVLIVISVAVLYTLNTIVLKGSDGMGGSFISMLFISPVIYAIYALIGNKLLNTTTPVAWFLATLVLIVPLREMYIQAGTGSIQSVMPFLLEHYATLPYLLMCILIIWLNCMSVFFVEWLMTKKSGLVVRRAVFKKLAIIGTICLTACPVIITILAFKIDGSGTIMGVSYIYSFWAGYKLLNAFGGISNQQFDELVSSRTEGTKSIDTYQVHTGDTAVIHGIRSALLWLSIGVAVMSVVFLSMNAAG